MGKRVVDIYKNDAVVRPIPNGKGLPDHLKGRKRSTVKRFTRAARRRMCFLIGNCGVSFRTMVTLTMSDELQPHITGASVRLARKRVLDTMRDRWCSGSYFWTLEFQKNETPHVHIWTSDDFPGGHPNTDERGNPFNLGESRRLGKVWLRNLGVPNGEAARRSARVGTRVEPMRKPDGAARYAAKYAAGAKADGTDQKRVPEWYDGPGKFWDCSEDIKAIAQGIAVVPESELLRWEREDRETGKKYSGPYKIQYNAAERLSSYKV